jgi:hypothetical protein
MKWGEITWIFLHTLSIKIHPDHYQKVKHELLHQIKNLCKSLPCPDCASHATQYMSKINVQPTKQDFIKMLVDFHNEVNNKLAKPQFPISQINKYETVDLTTAFHACKHVIQKQPYNPRIIMNKIKTRDCLYHLHLWLGQQRLIQH